MGYKLLATKTTLVLSLMILGAAGTVAVAGGSLRPSNTLPQVPAVYVFGDSTMDVGNNNYLPGKNVPRVGRPYGVDMPGSSEPSGRFSNGYNTADFVAKSMGFESSPPYVSLAPNPIQLVQTALTTGVNYASSGAGILDSTNAGTNIPLSGQVKYFNATWSKMVDNHGSDAVRVLLSRSVFLVGVGGNDLSAFTNAEEHAQNKSAAERHGDVAAFYARLISVYSATITELYTMGARKFAVINVGLAGCLPIARVLDAAGACSDSRNKLAAGFNDAIRSLLASLATRLHGLVYSLADSYGIMAAIFANPGASGFTDVASACCGGGRLGADGCRPTSPICADHDQHYFWDNIHPSQRAASVRVQAFYDSPAQYTTPINFKQLVQSHTRVYCCGCFSSGTQVNSSLLVQLHY